MRNGKEIVYIRAVRESGGLGDSTRCLAVLQGLRKKYPNAKIHYYGADYLKDLISPRSTAFDLYIPCQYGLRPREALADNSWPHLNRGIKYALSVNMWCEAYPHEAETQGLVCQDRVELWCKHACVDVSRPLLNPTNIDLLIRDNYKAKYKKIIGWQVGATCLSREYPYYYTNQLLRMFKQYGYHVILFDVCRRWSHVIDASQCEVSIQEDWHRTIGKLLACDLVITPDSGFYHLAGCLGIKTLGIFGCTSGQIISRPWQIDKITHHYLQLRHDEIDKSKLPATCQPICYMRWERGWSSDRYRKQNKYCAIIEQITPERVFAKVKELLA